MTARPLRVVRGGAATAIAVLLAAVSHTYGGGAAPAPLLLVAVALLAWPFATLLAARRLGLVGVAVASVAAQALLHVAFAVTAGSTPMGCGHLHDTIVLTGGSSLPVALPDTPMLVCHGIAVVVAILAIGFGERMLRAIARWVTAHARRAIAVPAVAPSRRFRCCAVRRVFARRAPALHPLRRRGPPRRPARAA